MHDVTDAGHAGGDLYAVLDVSKSASETEVRRAYRNLITKAHPDKGGHPERFRAIQKAFEVLSDTGKRSRYDATGEVERSLDEELMDGFAGGNFRDRMRAAEAEAAASSVEDRITLRQSLDFQSHTAKFEAWMRARGGVAAADVVTADTLAEQIGVVKSSYEAVPLPHVSQLVVKCEGPGDPESNLKLNVEDFGGELGWGEVLVDLQYAPINPADIYSARLGGLYGPDSITCPYTCGHDGVAIVSKVGPGVKVVSEGDWVLPSHPFMGTWRAQGVWRERDVVRVEGGLMPLELMALCREMATAYRLLEDHGALKPGDCVILNAATSVVGQCILQLCALLKLRAVAVVRFPTSPPHPSDAATPSAPPPASPPRAAPAAKMERTIAWLKSLGASHVLQDRGSLKAELERLRFFARPKLALDSVGGESAVRLADTLQEGGEVVIYGCMSGQPPVWHWQQWVFKGLKVSGFNLRTWASGNKGRLVKVLEALSKVVKGGKLSINYTEYQFESEFNEALEHACEESKQTKVLLKFGHQHTQQQQKQQPSSVQ